MNKDAKTTGLELVFLLRERIHLAEDVCRAAIQVINKFSLPPYPESKELKELKDAIDKYILKYEYPKYQDEQTR